MADLAQLPHGQWVRTAGLVLVRQRPGSASGVTFMTLEDETGQLNLIVWRNIAERFRRPLVEAALLEVQGTLQREGTCCTWWRAGSSIALRSPAA